ncbi:MAG: hypothetical protein AABX01_00450 [Candidatus Micrarchaeota archaeon]
MAQGKKRAQASFFDGVLFMLTAVFSVSLIFITLDNYGVAQDKLLRTAYLANYMQSTSKALYYLDVSTLWDVKSYCKDADTNPGIADNPGATVGYYCNEGGPGEKYDLDCKNLSQYSGRVTVADLLKKDADTTDGTAGQPGGLLDDKFGTSAQMGRTALRCAMKEIMKPFTFSGYRYISEIADATGEQGIGDFPKYMEGQKYASDYMFTKAFREDIDEKARNELDCSKIDSNQLLVIRSPFKILELNDEGDNKGKFTSRNYVLRTCIWPSDEGRE